jgi:type IV secretion system protein VirB10
MVKRLTLVSAVAGGLLFAQAPDALPQQSPQLQSTQTGQQPPAGLKQRETPPPAPGLFTVPPGTRILLNMINSVSTKQAQPGDRIYLETAFPVSADNRIVIPQGSWVTGTVLEVKRPGRAKGRGELQVRFDSITLPNGVSRTFRGDMSQLDGRSQEDINREQSKIKGPSDKTGDVGTVITTTAAGAGIGTAVGAAAGHIGQGAVIGLGAGAAAGLLGVLLTRGPDALIAQGSSLEMTLDRPLMFAASDLDFSNVPPRAVLTPGSQTAPQQRRTLGSPIPFPY